MKPLHLVESWSIDVELSEAVNMYTRRFGVGPPTFQMRHESLDDLIRQIVEAVESGKKIEGHMPPDGVVL